jgi:uncharacterized protein (TIGR02246 family)
MRLLMTMAFATLLSSCATSGAGVSSDAKEQVAAATASWAAAFNSRDPARITAAYDPEAVLWGTISKEIRTNPAAIADYFKDAGKRPNGRVSIGEQNIRVYGDIAVNSGYYTFSDLRDGNNIEVPARFSMVYKNRNGKWMIVDHHSSRVPAP